MRSLISQRKKLNVDINFDQWEKEKNRTTVVSVISSAIFGSIVGNMDGRNCK